MRLKELQGAERIKHWQQLASNGQFATLVEELLVQHYDPQYARSQRRNFAGLEKAPRYAAADLGATSLAELAQRIVAEIDRR